MRETANIPGRRHYVDMDNFDQVCRYILALYPDSDRHGSCAAYIWLCGTKIVAEAWTAPRKSGWYYKVLPLDTSNPAQWQEVHIGHHSQIAKIPVEKHLEILMGEPGQWCEVRHEYRANVRPHDLWEVRDAAGKLMMPSAYTLRELILISLRKHGAEGTRIRWSVEESG